MTGADDPDAPRRPRELQTGERPPPSRRPAYNDLRDDYDEDFLAPPTSLAMRRVIGPAVAFLVIGVLGLLGMLATAVGVVLEFSRRAPTEDRILTLALFLWLIFLGCCLFTLIFAGGVCMLRLRRYRLALAAAFAVTGLSVMGLYAILFYPFGIWALIVLFRADVEQEFDRPPAPGPAPGEWGERP